MNCIELKSPMYGGMVTRIEGRRLFFLALKWGEMAVVVGV